MRVVLLGLACACLLLAGLFGGTFYRRHVANRDFFNDAGRCFDPQTGTVILEQAGGVWLVLCGLSLAAFLLLLTRLRRHR